MRNYKLYADPMKPGAVNGHDALFKALFDESPDAIFLLHPGSFEIMDCNVKALQLFQAEDKNELTGKESFTLYDSEPVQFSKNTFMETINKGMEHSQEMAFRSLKGNIFWGRTAIRKVDTLHGSVIIFRVRRVLDYMKTTEMLAAIIKLTAKVTGYQYFSVLTELLSKNFGVSTAMVARIDQELRKAICISCWHKVSALDNLSFDLDPSPSMNVLKGYTTFYPNNLPGMFPCDRLIRELDVVSYMGTPVFEASGDVHGLLILMDEKTMEEIPNARYILSLFASRCSAEFERIEIEESYRKKIFELGGTV